jgi:hypothetical protein
MKDLDRRVFKEQQVTHRWDTPALNADSVLGSLFARDAVTATRK